MAKIFLDANAFIDVIERGGKIRQEDLEGHRLVASPLSVHILTYLTKQTLPYQNLTKALTLFSLVPFETQICQRSLIGPTPDFEDNVQLHSAVQAECDIFLTNDKQLLKLKFFGKMQLVPAKGEWVAS